MSFRIPSTGPRPVPYRVVDAFASGPFSGNPAAVVLPGPWTDALNEDEALLQAIAAEMNLAETAYPSEPDGSGRRNLRWFTPTTEVTLCGHATLAAAHALLEEGVEAPLRFTSLSGPLVVEADDDDRLRLDFPSDPPAEVDSPKGLMAALGLPAETPFFAGRRCAVVPLDSGRQVARLAPAMEALGRVRLPDGVLGVAVTAPDDETAGDIFSRFFGPWVGVPEDPVTGMAHTALGPYWAERMGRHEIRARQGSSRQGSLVVRVDGDRVHLVGRAVTVARGELLLPLEAE
jgi:PhzF family phenazine biosynthesis protein